MKKTITEDMALGMKTTLDVLVNQALLEGFKETKRYHHPAVGTIVELEK